MLELGIALLVVVAVAALLFRLVIDVVTVRDYQRGVRFRNGRLVGLLATGTHVAVRPYTEIQLLDVRPTLVAVPRQEILTADGVPLKVSVVARYVVADPVTAITGDQSWLAALYAAVQAALRQVVAGRTAQEVLAVRNDLGPTIAAAIGSEVARIGIELLGVDVRDVMVPAELKRASIAVVAARLEGEAAVERARAETASLRTLANAAQLIDDNPGLRELRASQQQDAPGGEAPAQGGAGNGATMRSSRGPRRAPATARPEDPMATQAGAPGGSAVGRPSPGG